MASYACLTPDGHTVRWDLLHMFMPFAPEMVPFGVIMLFSSLTMGNKLIIVIPECTHQCYVPNIQLIDHYRHTSQTSKFT